MLRRPRLALPEPRLAILLLPPALLFGAAPLGAGPSPGVEASQATTLAEGPAFAASLRPRPEARTSEAGTWRVVGAALLEPPPGAIFTDDFESGDLTAWAPPYGMPSGTVAFFQTSDCPAGWQPLESARGRALVGRPLGGTPGGISGSPLADLENRRHGHVFAAGTLDTSWVDAHSHWWSILWEDLAWRSYSADYSVITLIDWNDGIDAEGQGYYPFAAAPGTYPTYDGVYATTEQGYHKHQGNFGTHMSTYNWLGGALPHLQLLACRKS